MHRFKKRPKTASVEAVMTRAQMEGFKDSSNNSYFVIIHAYRQRQLGKGPSMAFRGEKNPRKALILAIRQKDSFFAQETMKYFFPHNHVKSKE